METSLENQVAKAYAPEQSSPRDFLGRFARYCKRNPSLLIGLILLAFLILFSFVGRFFVDMQNARPISVAPAQAAVSRAPFWQR